MGTHQFRQLPVFIGSIHLLNNHVLLPDKFGWGNAKMFLARRTTSKFWAIADVTGIDTRGGWEHCMEMILYKNANELFK